MKKATCRRENGDMSCASVFNVEKLSSVEGGVVYLRQLSIIDIHEGFLMTNMQKKKEKKKEEEDSYSLCVTDLGSSAVKPSG